MQTFSLNNQLGDLLKELRTKKGWSLRKAGEESGVSYSYISLLEKGIHSSSEKNSKVSPEQLKKLADAYAYPYNLLMIKAGYGESSEINADFQDQVKHMVSAGCDSVPEQIDHDYNYVVHINYFEDDNYYSSLEHELIREEILGWDNPKTAGDRIKELRLQKRLTIKELSEQLVAKTIKKNFMSIEKFTEEKIASIEENKYDPSISFLVAVSDFFNVSIDFIIKGKDYDLIETDNLSSEEAKIALDNTREQIIQELQETIRKIKGQI